MFVFPLNHHLKLYFLVVFFKRRKFSFFTKMWKLTKNSYDLDHKRSRSKNHILPNYRQRDLKLVIVKCTYQKWVMVILASWLSIDFSVMLLVLTNVHSFAMTSNISCSSVNSFWLLLLASTFCLLITGQLFLVLTSQS